MRSLIVCLLLLLPATGLAARADIIRKLHRETSILTALERLTSQVVSIQEQLDDLKRQQAELKYQVDEARRRVSALNRRAVERRAQLRRRVRCLYKLSRGGLPRLVLDSAGGGNLEQRLSAARLILRRDTKEIALYRHEHRRLEREQAALQGRLDHSQALGQQLAGKHAELRRTRDHRQRLLHRLQRSRRAQGELESELDQQQLHLIRRIVQLTYRVRTAGGLASRRGTLRPPVPGPVVGVFGQRMGGHEIDVLRHGMTFRPARGARVRAIEDGTVRMAGPLPGYGEIVLMEHEDGYFTLYGHLSATTVHAGERVREHQAVGTAGRDPLTGRSSVYFEIRRGERALDPAVWIRR